MKTRLHIYIIFVIIFFNNCSNTRFLTDQEILYAGRSDIEIQNPEKVKNTGEVRSYVKSVTTSKPNNSLFGLRVLPPVPLWIYNYAKPKKDKGLGNWFHKTFSRPPVLLTDVNPELRAAKIQNELNNRGFFHSTAVAAIHNMKHNTKKAKVSYTIELHPPWEIHGIVYDSALQNTDSLLKKNRLSEAIEPGDRFDLSDIKKVKASLSQTRQENGYYFFIPDYIYVNADSGIGDRGIDLFFGMKDNPGKNVLSRYRINDITIRLTREGGNDSALTDTLKYKEALIISQGTIIKPGILYNCVDFRKGDLYSVTSYRKTLSNLNDLNVFRLVNMNFEVPDKDTASHLLDVRIEILVPNSVSLSFESNLVTKSTGFTGPAVIAGIQHSNTFKGAEKLELTLRSNLEWQWYKNYSGELGSFSYEAGANASFVVPGIILLKGVFNRSNMVTRSTTINGGFSMLNRTAFYRLSSFRAGLSYHWGYSERVKHTLYPLYLNSVKLLKTTAAFDSVINSNIYIKRSFEEQFIIGPRYEFSFENKTAEKKSTVLFLGGVYTSGSLIGLISAKPNESNGESETFMNAVYAQFAKFTSDFRYYLPGDNQMVALRIYAGIGLPYGNSSVLPYVEQFFSGGAYSIRGFPARGLGPGSYYDGSRKYIDQSGDSRLEMNIEYRIKFSKLLNGALFLETGNVWLANDDPARPGAHFRSETFISQLAVGTGFGLRFDLGFFVLRTDFGMPLRTPYLINGSHNIGNLKDILKESVFHLAIGYPF